MLPLKKLSGNELKILLAICYCQTRGRFSGLETLMKFDLSYPTILTCVKALKAAGIIRRMDDGTEIVVELVDPWDQFAEHLKHFAPQLTLMAEGPEMEKEKVNLEILRAVVAKYAELQGVDHEAYSAWARENFAKVARAASRLIIHCARVGDDPVAVLERAAAYYKNQRVSWSLQGAVLGSIHRFLRPASTAGSAADGKYPGDKPKGGWGW